MKYLKTWMGVTSGSMAGRDDGYPEMKFRHYNNIEELAKEFGKHKDEKYYKLTELSVLDLNIEVEKALKAEKEKAKAKKKEDILNRIKKLQDELKELS